MADHSKPTTTSLYAAFVTELNARLNDLAMMLDPARTTVTNQPTGAIRWASASSKWQVWNGSAWADLAATYAINALTASSAAKWTTARTITLSGDVTGSASVDGSANKTITATLANSGVTAGTYKSVTVDAKGRVTGGTNPTTLSGYGIADAALKDMSNVADGAIAPEKVAQDASNRFMTDVERTKLSGIATGAEVNQNAFSQVAVSGQTACDAGSKTSKLTLSGSNGVAITTDASTDTVFIAGVSASTTEKGVLELATSGETTGLSDMFRAIVPANLLGGVKAALNASGTAPIYACRAWVNFDGTTTTPTIRASGNVSSITKNSAGDYTINFQTALLSAGYAVSFSQTGASETNMGGAAVIKGSFTGGATTKTTAALRIQTFANTGESGMTDHKEINVAIFR